MTFLRNFIAILSCKLLVWVSKLLGKKGSSGPGAIALKISPSILKTLAKKVKKEIIFVCGTNGKTTTNNLIYTLLENDGNNVVCNNVGANMLYGIACAFITKASVFGNLNADYAVLECDEAYLRHAVNHIKPSKILITNLFRDQMDRYGEIEQTSQFLNEAIEKVPDATLILNADDPICVALGKDRKAIYYGISEDAGFKGQKTNDGRFCHICGGELSYSYRHYSQLGCYECEKCGFKRPNPNYSATRIDMTDGLKFVLSYKGIQHKLKVNYRGFYNIYNIIGSFSAYESCGGSMENAQKVFSSYKAQLGRMEGFDILGKQAVLNLAKNPAGFNQSISAVCDDKRQKDILFAVNDAPSDGMDISWIYDVDFEPLKDSNVNKIYVSGTRKYDLALRLKLAGFENVEITELDKTHIESIISSSKDVCYLVVNYTALFGTQDILKGLEVK